MNILCIRKTLKVNMWNKNIDKLLDKEHAYIINEQNWGD